MVGIVLSGDPDCYAGGSLATGRVSRVRQVKGDDPDKKGYPGRRGRGLSDALTTPALENIYCCEDSPTATEQPWI
jgi:hypothetical protein